MPPDVRPPIGPIPANVGVRPSARGAEWGRTLWLFITLTIAFAAFFNAWDSRPTGTVTLLIRDFDGGRSTHTFSLASGALAPRADIAPEAVTTVSSHTFELSDGSVVTLGAQGVIKRGGVDAESFSVLVASPIAPLLNTPLSVWGDGALLAWVSPTDGSVQVFARSERGAYLPIYLSKDMRVNSLGFTEDGSQLALATLRFSRDAAEGSGSTELTALNLVSGRRVSIGSFPGFVSIIQAP